VGRRRGAGGGAGDGGDTDRAAAGLGLDRRDDHAAQCARSGGAGERSLAAAGADERSSVSSGGVHARRRMGVARQRRTGCADRDDGAVALARLGARRVDAGTAPASVVGTGAGDGQRAGAGSQSLRRSGRCADGDADADA